MKAEDITSAFLIFMEIQERFEKAVAMSKQMAKPSNEELLLLYGLFKQSSEGDVKGDRPGGFDFKAIAKFDAWEEQKGKSKEQAMKEYADLIEGIQKRN